MCAFHSRRPIKKCADAIDERSFIRSPLNKYATEGGTERRTVTVGAGRERRERESARARSLVFILVDADDSRAVLAATTSFSLSLL